MLFGFRIPHSAGAACIGLLIADSDVTYGVISHRLNVHRRGAGHAHSRRSRVCELKDTESLVIVTLIVTCIRQLLAVAAAGMPVAVA